MIDLFGLNESNSGVLGAECDDNMNFDIGLKEMLQP
jgi:hypothetical protein